MSTISPAIYNYLAPHGVNVGNEPITDNLNSHNSLQTRTLPGWESIPVSIRCSFRREGAGSIFSKAGGVCFDTTRWPDKASPIPKRSSWPHAWPLLNSTDEPGPGSGGDHPSPSATIDGLFVIAFPELLFTG